MKTYQFQTESDSGTVEATDLRAAMDLKLRDFSDAAIEGGAFLRVEDQRTGEHLQIGERP